MKSKIVTISLVLFSQIALLSQELISFQDPESKKMGLKNNKDEIIVSPKYDAIEPFSEKLAVVRIGTYSQGKFGFINSKGEEVIPLEYAAAESFSEGLALVSKKVGDNKYVYEFIDKTGKVIIPFEHTVISGFSHGLAAISKEYKYGYINKRGEIAIPIRFDSAEKFSEGLAKVALGRSGPESRWWGFINTSGKVVIPFKYWYVNQFKEGRALVIIEGKEFFIDKTGKTIEPFDFVGKNYGGITIVSKNKKFGYIDRMGHTIIPLNYDEAEPFSKGIARVRLGEDFFYINHKNQRVVTPEKDDGFWEDFFDGW